MFFVSRRKYERDLAAAKAEADRLRTERDTSVSKTATAVYNRDQILRQNAEQDATNRRLHDRNLELGRRLSKLRDADPEYAASLEQRVARLLRVGARLLAAYAAEQRRADRLSSHLDDGDLKAIKAWEARIKAHDGWTAPANLEQRPIDGGAGRPVHPATELRRALDRCRQLEMRLSVAERRKEARAS